ncbi:unnamed protein product, partial [Aureobasidium uvarum]
MGGRQIRTGMGALEVAVRSSWESVVFLLLASGSGTVMTSWNHANNSAIRRRGDRWQDHIILLALSTSSLSGLGLGYDMQTTVLGIVSWVVIAALMLSSVSHGIARRFGYCNAYDGRVTQS